MGDAATDENHLMANIGLLDGYLRVGHARSQEAQDTSALVQKFGPLQVDDHPRLSVDTVVASYFWETDDNEKALQLFKEIYKKQQKLLPPDHDDLMFVGVRPARAYLWAERKAPAIQLVEYLITNFTKKNGAGDHEVLEAAHLLAVAKFQLRGQNGETIQDLERIVNELKKIHSEGFPSLLGAEHHLANMYRADGRVPEAARLTKSLVERYCRLDPPDSQRRRKAEQDLKALRRLETKRYDHEEMIKEFEASGATVIRFSSQ